MPTIIRNGITYGGGGGTGNASNKYSTEEQVIGTWIDGKPIYRIVSSEPIDFLQDLSNAQELIGDTGNFSGNTRWSTITATYVDLWSQDIGNNYVDICVPISTVNTVLLTRQLTRSNGLLSGFTYWLGTTQGGNDIATIKVPSDDYFKETCTDVIRLDQYQNKCDEVYIRIVLSVVSGNAVTYRYTSITLRKRELKPEYSYALKQNEKLGIEETGFMYCSEYTKSNA